MAGVAAAPRRAISRSIATRCNRPAVIQGCGELAGAAPSARPRPWRCFADAQAPLRGAGGAQGPATAHCRIPVHQAAQPTRGVALGPPLRPMQPCTPPPEIPQGVVGDATPPASTPWDARGHLGTAAWAKGHSVAPKCADGTAWPGFGTSPETTDFRFQPELRTNWPPLRPLRRAARVAHASRTSREGSRLPWSRHRRDGFVLDASFVPFGTVLS